ncbi:MAG: hypothetical protein LAT51_01540 [Flavobacteriaceae bacterium]|nr:hypothetical protein [Flavobacteriaceae bacterium]
MNKKIILLIILNIVISSCSTKIKTTVYQQRPGIAYADQIPIFTLTDDLPENAKIIGELSFSGNLDYDCTTQILIDDISREAKSQGANAIKIKNYIPNNDLCPDIDAYLVYLENINEYQDKKYEVINEPDLVVVHFYRRSLADLHTQFIRNTIYINEDATFELRNRSKATVLMEPGTHTFRLEDDKNGITKDLKPGETYFVKVNMAPLNDRKANLQKPEMNVIDPLTGILEFESFNNRRANSYTYNKQSFYELAQLKENETLQQQIENKFKLKKKYYDQITYKAYTPIPESQVPNNKTEYDSEVDSLEYVVEEDSDQNDLFVQFYLGYNTSSFNFKDAYVHITPENFPDIEKELEPSTIQHGFDLGVGIGKEELFMRLDIWFLIGERFERGQDMVTGVSLGLGGRYAIVPEGNHYWNWGLGIGGNDLSRGIYREGDLTATLRNRKWALTPQLKYEYQIPKTKISIYAQARYVLTFGNVSKHSGVEYEEKNLGRNEDRTETTNFRFRSPELEVDANGRLNYGSRLDFSVGVMYNFK